jgi:hypothetical protein
MQPTLMMEGGEMKVSELIAQLSEVNQDSEVFLWVDGERIAVHSVDDNFSDDWYVDINADTITREFKV